MIRMLRSALPRTMEFLPATIHEHILCFVPDTDRTWHMKPEMVPLTPKDLLKYRATIDAFKRKQLNQSGADGRMLWLELESFLREKYEGRTQNSYGRSSVMGEAFAKVATSLVRKKRRPLVFADTSQEGEFLLRVLRSKGLDACAWSEIASQAISSTETKSCDVIVASKNTEAHGINMQRFADCLICRPTPGDHLEQMKGRIDRPGQQRKDLLLVVVVAEHTIEEAKFANIHLAGSFFREYIAPVATKYKERVDLEATLSVGGMKKLKRGTVIATWRRSIESAGQSGTFAEDVEHEFFGDAVSDLDPPQSAKIKNDRNVEEPKYKPLNKVLRNKGDPIAVREARSLAKLGGASPAIRNWLLPCKKKSLTCEKKAATKAKPLPKVSLLRFSDSSPPLVLDRPTIERAVAHLSRSDEKLASLIARVGVDALVNDFGNPRIPTQAGLFDKCLRAITFTMVSIDAGNAFLRRLAIKLGVCLERKPSKDRNRILGMFVAERGQSVSSPDEALSLLINGRHDDVKFTHGLVNELVQECEIIKGKRTGYPHLCGVTHPCGKNDDHRVFIQKARGHAANGCDPVSAGFSAPKASFIVSLVEDFESGKISAEQIAKASDREAAKMLMELDGIGDWCAGGVLMHFLSRADIMLYGDLTVRNYLNDLYSINHRDDSETFLESAADFGDTGPNRDLIDALARNKSWSPFRSVVCYLMYHLQEENLVLL